MINRHIASALIHHGQPGNLLAEAIRVPVAAHHP
jgi:hypothetical protein